MRRLAAAGLALLMASPAWAQRPPPAPAPYPQLQPGQVLPAVPPPPGTGAGGSAPAQAPSPASPPPAAAAPVAPVAVEWVNQGQAELRVLDKVTARTVTLAVKQGETLRHGPLAITLRGCVVRPPDRPPEAAAYLEIVDGTGGPGFRGWMLTSAPALAGLESPTWDVRPLGCRP